MKEIKGFSGYYIDECGNVYSDKQHNEIRKLSTWEGHNSRYDYITLCNGTRNKKMIHRLVAETFIPNPNNYDVVHHKDGNTHNNCVDNLEWTTQQQNIHRSYDKLGPSRNYIEAKVVHNDEIVYIAKSINETASYCHEHYGTSISSLIKYKYDKRRNIRLDV